MQSRLAAFAAAALAVLLTATVFALLFRAPRTGEPIVSGPTTPLPATPTPRQPVPSLTTLPAPWRPTLSPAPSPSAPTPSAARELPISISGTVVDSRAGTPIPRARVATRLQGGGPVRGVETNGSGEFRFHDLRPGAYDVMATAEGFLVDPPVRAQVAAGAPGLPAVAAGAVRIALEPGLEVFGLVVDGASARPVTGAALMLVGETAARWAPPYQPLLSGDDGRFRIPGVPRGSGLRLAVRARGFLPSVVDLPPVTGPGALLGVRVALSHGGRISGRVEALDGAPVAGAHVRALFHQVGEVPEERGDADSGESGEFSIEGLPDGPYLVGAEKGGASSAEPAQTLISQGISTGLVVLKIAVVGPIEGTVSDAQGAPIEGAVVSAAPVVVVDPSRHLVHAKTGADGRFQLDAGSGRFNVRARKPGFQAAQQAGVAGGAVGVTIELQPGGAPSQVAGRIVGPGGKPLPGLVLRLDLAGGDEADGTEARTGKDGAIVDTAVSPGSYTVSFVEPGAPPGELRVRVREMDAAPGAPLDVTLDDDAPRGAVRGVARLLVGLPPADGAVQIQLVPAERPRDAFGFVAAVAAAEDGTFSFASVPPGRYVVRAVCDAGTESRRGQSPVEVAPGGEASVDITMQ